jgi:hypothetical protein
MVQQKVDVVAGEVVAAMLQLSRPHETRLQEDRSAPLAETAITAAVTESIAAGHAKHLLQPDKVSGTRASQLLQAHVLICVLILCGRGASLPGCRHVRGAHPVRRCSALHTPEAPCSPQLVTCVGEGHGGASYCVNMKRIIDLIRMKEVRCQL